MNLLLDEIDVLETAGDPSAVEVRGVEHDSRRVSPGDLFCCLAGTTSDGHAHAGEAVRRGAVGIVCEHAVQVSGPAGSGSVVQATVAPGTARPAMARLAAAFWGHPSRDLVMAGVTGTNGKTTVSHLLGAVLEGAGHPTAVIGTLTGERTTPEATDLQRLLAGVRDGASQDGERPPAVAMEVSSHALVQARVDTIHFDVAVFTNLSHDHLDYHGTMEAYFEAKASLFTPERAVVGVVGAGDPWGRRLLDEPRIPLLAVRREQASHVRLEAGRSTFVWRDRPVALAMTGMLNVENALLAAEAAVALGVEPGVVAAALTAAPPVPGRLETVSPAGAGPCAAPGLPFCALVDYAHTPAGLAACLVEARRLADPGARVIVVFGCGGDRDQQKRPVMGAVATGSADVTILTTDNPRREDPGEIIVAVAAGVVPSRPEALRSGHLVVEPDRRRAIERAVGIAGPGDVVVVAGKGHEQTQEVAGAVVPFDDRAVLAEVLAEVLERGGSRHGSPRGSAPGGEG